MRRKRQVVQVNTFPFLAVLLCAMGSLILLLLVIDRRAKVVARTRAMEAVAIRAAKRSNLPDVDRAEWQRKCRELHALLGQQEEELEAHIRSFQKKASRTLALIHAEDTSVAELKKNLAKEKASLDRILRDWQARRKSLTKVAEKEKISKEELTHLALEVRDLERTLEALKALRKNQQEMFSLVPYHGRYGDSRKPIYVECNVEGLVFQPGRKLMPAPAIDSPTLLAEIERRMGALKQAEGGLLVTREKIEAAKKENPYVLFLVRPEGINSYYLALRALRSLPVDFGYELVEARWEFDFSAEEKIAAQPWYQSGLKGKTPLSPSAIKRSLPDPRRPRTWGLGPGTNTGQYGPGSVMGGSGPAGVGSGSQGSSAPGSSLAKGSSPPPIPGSGPRFGPGIGPGGNGSGFWNPGLPGTNLNPSARGRQPPDMTDWKSGPALGGSGPTPWNAGSGPENGFGRETGFPGYSRKNLPGSGPGGSGLPSWNGGLGTDPGSRPPGLAPSGSGVNAGILGSPLPSVSLGFSPDEPKSSGNPSPRGGRKPPEIAGGSLPAIGPAGNPNSQGSPGFSGWSGSGSSGSSGSSGNPGNPGTNLGANFGVQSTPELGPPGGANEDAIAPSPLMQPAGTNSGSSKNLSGRGGVSPPVNGGTWAPGSGSTGSGGSGPGVGLSSPLSLLAPLPSRPSRALPLSRIIGNKDFVINLECRAGSIVIQPWALVFPEASLPIDPEQDNGLKQAVTKLIARRQATVQPGEPPYRPVINFQVRPDGLRSFYRAYPLLENLGHSMTRENLDSRE